MLRFWCLLLPALLVPAPLPAQGTPVAQRTLLLELRADSTHPDSGTVWLRVKRKYYGDLTPPFGKLDIRAARKHGQAVLSSPASADEATLFIEVYPRETGQHLVRLYGVGGGESVIFRLWSDSAEAAAQDARRKEEHERSWGIGLSVGGGRHSGYLIKGPPPPAPPAAGNDVEVGLVLGTSGRFSGILGYNRQVPDSGSRSVSWLFVEPRLRLLQPVLLAGRRTGLGVSFRVAEGNPSGITVDPTLKAVGAFITQHLDRSPGSRGWAITLSYWHGWLSNVQFSNQQQDRVAAALSWLP